jgi:REP element-mobilizing transposase RayT
VAGAGRKPTPGRRPGIPHRPRAAHLPSCPAHVTLRAERGLSSLRDDALFAALRTAISAACSATFRVIEFSVQTDHLHLVAEADRADGLSRGIHALACRAAKAINRSLRRHGRVWATGSTPVLSPRRARCAMRSST